MKEKLITILGPTASGKSEVGIEIAKALGSSITSGDAFQVYKEMDIGTAKVTKEEMQGIPHYLVDCIDPREPYSAADFQKKASEIITRENKEGRIPVLVGGTGLYIQSLLEGYSFLPKSDQRKKWHDFYLANGKEGLEREIKKAGVREIPDDPQRMLRKLELIDAEGRDLSPEKSQSLIYDGPVIGIAMDRAVLYDRINKRVCHMMQDGLYDEVQKLLDSGNPETAQSLKAIGYREMVQCIKGELSIEEAEALIQKNTRHFAKRQITWYKRMPYIHWYEKNEFNQDTWCKEITDYVISYFRGECEDGR